jgi:hypothetical protein
MQSSIPSNPLFSTPAYAIVGGRPAALINNFTSKTRGVEQLAIYKANVLAKISISNRLYLFFKHPGGLYRFGCHTFRDLTAEEKISLLESYEELYDSGRIGLSTIIYQIPKLFLSEEWLPYYDIMLLPIYVNDIPYTSDIMVSDNNWRPFSVVDEDIGTTPELAGCKFKDLLKLIGVPDLYKDDFSPCLEEYNQFVTSDTVTALENPESDDAKAIDRYVAGFISAYTNIKTDSRWRGSVNQLQVKLIHGIRDRVQISLFGKVLDIGEKEVITGGEYHFDVIPLRMLNRGSGLYALFKGEESMMILLRDANCPIPLCQPALRVIEQRCIDSGDFYNWRSPKTRPFVAAEMPFILNQIPVNMSFLRHEAKSLDLIANQENGYGISKAIFTHMRDMFIEELAVQLPYEEGVAQDVKSYCADKLESNINFLESSIGITDFTFSYNATVGALALEESIGYLKLKAQELFPDGINNVLLPEFYRALIPSNAGATGSRLRLAVTSLIDFYGTTIGVFYIGKNSQVKYKQLFDECLDAGCSLEAFLNRASELTSKLQEFIALPSNTPFYIAKHTQTVSKLIVNASSKLQVIHDYSKTPTV